MVKKNKSTETKLVELRIKEVGCWNCKKAVRLSFISDGLGIDDPSKFNEKELSLARQNGVKIEIRTSPAWGEYNAMICLNCDSHFGLIHLHDYWYEPDILVIQLDIKPVVD